MAENTKHYTEHDRELSNTNPTKTRRCTQMSSKLIHITQLLPICYDYSFFGRQVKKYR